MVGIGGWYRRVRFVLELLKYRAWRDLFIWLDAIRKVGKQCHAFHMYLEMPSTIEIFQSSACLLGYYVATQVTGAKGKDIDIGEETASW